MSFQSGTSTNHIKYMGVVATLVITWFLYTVPTTRYHITPESALIFSGSPLDLLPLAEATDYCKARRWEPYPYREGRRKIYDLMLINTELDWLEIRMGQMADQVDYFVILEAAKTFTDEPKPLYVRENFPRFKQHHSKMILHTLSTDDVNFTDTWSRESFSRNAMYDQVIPFLTGPQAAFEGDVIIVSDVDEIPRPDALKALRNCDFPKELTLHTKMYYYGFQWLKRTDWPHPQATYYAHAQTVLPSTLRGSHGGDLYNAGWHCSYCFSTLTEMVTKIKSFSHSELDREEFTDHEKIVQRVRIGADMFGRAEEHFDRVEENMDVPHFLRAHREQYRYLLDRDGVNAGFVDYEPERDVMKQA